MEKKDIKPIVITAVSLLLICAVSAGILAFVNSVTAPLIAQNSAKTAVEARLEVLPGATDFTAKTDTQGREYFVGTSGDDIVGYVFTTSSAGYGGKIEVMTGVSADGIVTGISILTINETPGLGMNATKEEFLSAYEGKTGPFNVIKNSEPKENEIKAITSATISSKAVTNAVNEALEIYTSVKEG